MPSNSWFTVPELAKYLRVDAGKILRFIHTGELVAINIATRASGRPRWRVSEGALADFLLRRQSPAAPAPRVRRPKSPGIIEFY